MASPPPRSISDLPNEVLLKIAITSKSDLRNLSDDALLQIAMSRSDLPALVLVSKRFYNLSTPHMYETFRNLWPSPVHYQMPMCEQDLRRQSLPWSLRHMQKLHHNSPHQCGTCLPRQNNQAPCPMAGRGVRLVTKEEMRAWLE